MNHHGKWKQPHSIPKVPLPSNNTHNWTPPTHPALSFQPPNLPQFSPKEALKSGTLWKPLYDPYFTPRDREKSGAMARSFHHASEEPLDENLQISPPSTVHRDTALPPMILPDQGQSSEKAYETVHRDLALDGNPLLNLATFVTTWMDPYADRLYAESYNKNLIDKRAF